MLTRDDLIEFETDIAAAFERGEIHAPIHLSDGNEDPLIRCFKTIEPTDWCVGGWRFHTQCLLHGVPREKLKAAILNGESMFLSFPEHRILCSSIVGGILPIAIGIAEGIRQARGREKVHCWLGDMSAEGGQFHECRKYALGRDLPLKWYVEDNRVSVATLTRAAWGRLDDARPSADVVRYSYESRYPHSGIGKFVAF